MLQVFVVPVGEPEAPRAEILGCIQLVQQIFRKQVKLKVKNDLPFLTNSSFVHLCRRYQEG